MKKLLLIPLLLFSLSCEDDTVEEPLVENIQMFVNGAEINLYNFKDDSDIGFYDIKGKSIVKSLMKTPINGAR